jgi:hypothetical protein
VESSASSLVSMTSTTKRTVVTLVMAAPLVSVLTMGLLACALLWPVATPTGNEAVVNVDKALSLCFYWLLATLVSQYLVTVVLTRR